MAIDNRYTFRDALALYTKNLVLYDTDQETIQSGDDGKHPIPESLDLRLVGGSRVELQRSVVGRKKTAGRGG